MAAVHSVSFPTALGLVTATYALGYSIITLVLPYLTAGACDLDAAAVGADAGPRSTTASCAVGAGSYGVVMAAYPVAKALVTPVLGSMADAYGHRRVLMVSMGVTGLCFWGMGACGSLTCLLTLRFLSGLFAGIGAVLTALIVDVSAKHAPAQGGRTADSSPSTVAVSGSTRGVRPVEVAEEPVRAPEPAMQRPALLNRFNLCWNLAGVGGGVMVWASGGHLVVCCTIAGGCMLAGAAMVWYLLPPIAKAAGTRLHVAREQRADPSTPQAAATTGGPGTLSTIALLFRDPLTRWTLVLAAITPPFEVAGLLSARFGVAAGGSGWVRSLGSVAGIVVPLLPTLAWLQARVPSDHGGACHIAALGAFGIAAATAIVAGAPSVGVLVLAVAAREAIMVAVRPFRSSALLTLFPVGHSGLFTGVKESFKNAGFGVASLIHGSLATASPALPLAVGAAALIVEGLVFLNARAPAQLTTGAVRAKTE